MIDYSNYNPGDIIQYGIDPTINMTVASKALGVPTEARPLLFSDDPEYVLGPGIMYQDTVMGNFRVFAYHVNNSRRTLYFSVLLRNASSFPITITITKKAVTGPSADYTAVGKLSVGKWLLSTGGGQINLLPGQTVFLDSAEMPKAAGRSQLLHYLYDANATGFVQVSVVARPDKKPELSDLNIFKSSKKGKDSPMRGTFEASEFSAIYSSDLSGNGSYADGVAASPEYVTGWSAVDRVPTVNYGNYGVLYRTVLQITPNFTTRAAIVLNSRGGTFATWANVVMASPDLTEESGPFPVPSTQTSVGTNTLTQGVMLQKDVFKAGETKFIEIWWMPAGGTNLPIDILMQAY